MTIHQASWALCAALELVLLILWSKDDSLLLNWATLPAAALAFVLALELCSLSYMEHRRSVRPSSIISVYLTLTIVFDVVQCRTLWLMDNFRGCVAPVFLATAASKVLVLVLELQGKRKFLIEPWSHLSPESTSGVFNRSLFWWVNSLLLRGFKTILSVDSLYDTDDQLRSARLAEKLSGTWRSNKYSRFQRNRLVLAVCFALKGTLALAVIPRLLLISFKIAQPFLVKRVIEFVQQDLHDSQSDQDRRNVAWGLVLATFLVYLGTAVSRPPREVAAVRLLTSMRLRPESTNAIYSDSSL